MPKDPLAREQEMVVQIACHALTRTIEQYSPVGTDTLPIAAAAISRRAGARQIEDSWLAPRSTPSI
jgi:hypothetical protein